MNASETIKKYRSKIEKEMVILYREVLESEGKIEYKLYIWEDGETDLLECVQGDNCYLQAKDYEPRKLFYICTIDLPHFCPWDYTDHSKPENEDEQEKEREEIIDYLVAEYKNNVPEIVDSILSEAELEESIQS